MSNIKKIIFIFICCIFLWIDISYGKYVYFFEEDIIKLKRDTEPPICSIVYSTEEITNQNVKVTITCNKEVEQVSGFELSEDKKILTKEVTENSTEILTIRDLSGNFTEIQYNVDNIDKEPPKIIGCENGGKYKNEVELDYTDNHEIREILIDKYDENLIAKVTKPSRDEIIVKIEGHPLNTKKYRYYLNNELYSTTKETSYRFVSLNKEKEYTLKIEALDELGNILDTKEIVKDDILEEDKNTVEEIDTHYLTESGNYQIKANDLAGNETIYYIKIQ